MSERSNQLRESVDRNLTLHMRNVNHFFGWVIRSLRMRLVLSKLGTECNEEEDLTLTLHTEVTCKQSRREMW
jgi:hypothetical protein